MRDTERVKKSANLYFGVYGVGGGDPGSLDTDGDRRATTRDQ